MDKNRRDEVSGAHVLTKHLHAGSRADSFPRPVYMCLAVCVFVSRVLCGERLACSTCRRVPEVQQTR